MPAIIRRLATVGIAVVLACGRSPASDEARESLVSWSASTQEAGHAWLAAVVPSRYLTDLLEVAQQAVRDQASTLEGEPRTPVVDSLLHVAVDLGALIDSLGSAARARDHVALRGKLESLSTLDARLRALDKGATRR